MRNIFSAALIAAALIIPTKGQAQNFAFGVGVGTLGAEAFATRKITKNFDLLVGFSSLDYDDTFSDADKNSFVASATIEAPRIGIQFYPLSRWGMFMEGGMVFGAPEIGVEFKASETGSFEVGTQTYQTSEIGTLTGQAGFDEDVAPYVLFGLGRTVGGGLGLSLSVGAISYGPLSADLKNSQCTLGSNPPETLTACNLLQTNILIEEARINSDLEDFELWPFLRLGLSYSF